jgi:hypothetical protein
MSPNDARVKFVLRRGGRQFWIIVAGLSATLLLLHLGKAVQHRRASSAPGVSSRELDSLFQSALEGRAFCGEPMGEDPLAGKDPILEWVAPQVIGLDVLQWPTIAPTDGSGTGDTMDSTASKMLRPPCSSNGAAGGGTWVGPRCARPGPTLRPLDSGPVADLRLLEARCAHLRD